METSSGKQRGWVCPRPSTDGSRRPFGSGGLSGQQPLEGPVPPGEAALGAVCRQARQGVGAGHPGAALAGAGLRRAAAGTADGSLQGHCQHQGSRRLQRALGGGRFSEGVGAAAAAMLVPGGLRHALIRLGRTQGIASLPWWCF